MYKERNDLNELLELISTIKSDIAIRRLKIIVKDYLKKENEKQNEEEQYLV